MIADKEKILKRYEKEDEDGRFLKSRNGSMEFFYTKKHLSGFIKPDSRILEIGCGTGYYGMYFADKCAEYVGIDLVPKHISVFNEKIAESNLKNVRCAVGDATDLHDIDNNSFDVVLSLGPMYHLSEPERKKAFSECARVCKPGGIGAFAYITSCGVYAGACIDYGEIYPNELTNKNVFGLGTDDLRPGLFWYTMPEAIESEAKSHGFEKVVNYGTDFFIFDKTVNEMDEEKFELMRPLYDRISSSERCTGLSNHALLICKKKDSIHA